MIHGLATPLIFGKDSRTVCLYLIIIFFVLLIVVIVLIVIGFSIPINGFFRLFDIVTVLSVVSWNLLTICMDD